MTIINLAQTTRTHSQLYLSWFHYNTHGLHVGPGNERRNLAKCHTDNPHKAFFSPVVMIHYFGVQTLS